MKNLPRLYDSLLAGHLGQYRQMAFISGARQVGKTTLCRSQENIYLNWENETHRELILTGPEAVAENAQLAKLHKTPPVLVFDEIHKYSHWKRFLKGFFDTYEKQCRIIVTGSSRLDVYQRGGDSLMGRYFLYRVHPFSAGELTKRFDTNALTHPSAKLPAKDWNALLLFGGFPEPFCTRNEAFSRRWRTMRRTQLLKEDIRDMTRIQELDQLAIMERLLSERSGKQLIYSALARQVRVSEVTVQSWISTLCAIHHGFVIRPWHKNLSRALRKEPKWYLRDWSGIVDAGSRAETFIACHLLKAVETWNDAGAGNFELRYIRDKQKREVDFIVLREDEPWFLVEVKLSDESLSPSLVYFQKQTHAPHAFQVVLNMPFTDADCFSQNNPIVVPAATLLSQLP